MPEVYRKWRNKLFYYLKDKVRGKLTVEINEDTASLYLRVDDRLGRFERGIFELDRRMLTGDFNAEREGEWFLRQYQNYILGKFIRE